VTPTARDAQGDAVPGVTVEPAEVAVKVPLVQRSGFRNLSVRVIWEGQPAPGYRISNVSVVPTIVTVIGEPAKLEAIPGYLDTAPVKVDAATEDVVERVNLNLPDGVSAIGSQSVQVTISVTPIESSLTVRRQVVPQGLAPELVALPQPDSVDVIVSGPLPKLDGLRPEDVQVVVNLVSLTAGTYQLVPVVTTPEGIKVESVVPEKIQVDLIWRATATPTQTATPAPSPTPLPTSTPTATMALSDTGTLGEVAVPLWPGDTPTPAARAGLNAALPATRPTERRAIRP
jgi:YbbR domain-containing protein